MGRILSLIATVALLSSVLVGCTTVSAGSPENNASPMAFRAEDGSNNVNNNHLVLDNSNAYGNAKAVMITDGEQLYVSTMANAGQGGIFRCSLTDTDLSNAERVFIPDVVDESTFPIALGFLDDDNLCMLAPVEGYDELYNSNYGLYSIAIDGSTTGTSPSPYLTVGVENSGLSFQPKIVGNWLYYVSAISLDDSKRTLAFMRLDVSGEGEPQEICTFEEGRYFSVVFDGADRLFYIVCENGITPTSTIIEFNATSAETVEHQLSTTGADKLVGYHDGRLYYDDDALYELALDDGTETFVVEGHFGYALNFDDEALYLIDSPFLYRIPYDEYGASEYAHVELTQVSVDKFNQYEAGLVQGPLLTSYDPCLWFWNGNLWTFYSAGDWSCELHVLSLDVLSGAVGEKTGEFESDAAVEETPSSNADSGASNENRNTGTVSNATPSDASHLSGMYCIGDMSDDAPAMEFFADTGVVRIWNFDLGSFSISPESYMESTYNVTANGIEVCWPYGYEPYDVSVAGTGFIISKDGASFTFEKWG